MKLRHLLPILLVGCAASTALEPKPPSLFPGRDHLQALQATPAPSFDQRGKYQDVESWDLTGPLPGEDRDQARTPEHPWDQLLTDAVTTRVDTVANVAMHCAARELGLFHLSNGANAVPALQSFILARCGAQMPDIQMQVLGGLIDVSISDERLYTDWYDDLVRLMHQLPDDPQQAIGLWYGRRGDRALFFLVSGRRRAATTPVEVTETPNRFRFEGSLFSDATAVRALINRGKFGVAECDVERTTPRLFAVECEASPDDPYAWMEVVAFAGGRVVGSTVLNEIVFPGGAPLDRYVRSSIGDDRPIRATEDISEGILATANQIRSAAGMAPLELDRGESTTATRLAAHYFGDTVGKQPSDLANTVALGLRAGWDVDGVVRYGKLTAAAITGEATVGLIASTAIERPFNREVLLDPNVQRLAVGAMRVAGEQFNGAVIASYSLLTPEMARAGADKVLKRLIEARREAKSGPMRVLPLNNVPRLAEETLLTGELQPEEALVRFMNNAFYKSERPMDGWVVGATDLDELVLPEALVLADGLEVSIAVAYQKRQDEPWARFVVMFVSPTPAEEFLEANRKRTKKRTHHETSDLFSWNQVRPGKTPSDPGYLYGVEGELR